MYSFLSSLPICIAYSYPRTYRIIGFNREIHRVVKWWELETGQKFNGKILKDDFCYYDRLQHTIGLEFSDIHIIFHELQHYLQSKNKDLTSIYKNYHKLPYRIRKNYENYLKLPPEINARQASYRHYKKFLKQHNLSH